MITSWIITLAYAAAQSPYLPTIKARSFVPSRRRDDGEQPFPFRPIDFEASLQTISDTVAICNLTKQTKIYI